MNDLRCAQLYLLGCAVLAWATASDFLARRARAARREQRPPEAAPCNLGGAPHVTLSVTPVINGRCHFDSPFCLEFCYDELTR